MYIRQVVPDIIVIDPRRYSDERGWFRERYSQASWSAAGIGETWVQDNESLSQSVGTLRGLHFQIPPMAQAKVVSCAAGAILDVAVDIRRSSPTFGRHVSVELSAANGLLVYMPEGFAHGFCTLQPDTVVQYKVSRPYDPASERGLAWNDPALEINWRLPGETPVLSPRDATHPRLSALPGYF